MEDQNYKDYKQDVNYPRFNFDDVLALQCCMEIVKKTQGDKELYEQLQNLHDRVHDAYWLEKQGNIYITGDELEALRIAAYEPTKNWSEKLQSLYEKLAFCEQKPTNNIKLKFKGGDWIVSDTTHDVYKVLCAIDDEYTISHDIDGNVVRAKAEIIDKKCHLWSFEDVKDGDVIVFDDAFILIFKEKGDPRIIFPTKKTRGFSFKSHVYLDFLMNVFEQGSFCDDMGNKCHPATKEQRIALFAMMKEYGYEWDSEKKMLTKTGQKPVDNQFTPKQAKATNDWIEDYWQHHKVNNPDSYDSGDEIQFDHDGFVRFCNTYCKKPEWIDEDEKKFKGVISTITISRGSCEEDDDVRDLFDDEISWLESIKERMKGV